MKFIISFVICFLLSCTYAHANVEIDNNSKYMTKTYIIGDIKIVEIYENGKYIATICYNSYGDGSKSGIGVIKTIK